MLEPKNVVTLYVTPNNKSPIKDWLEKLDYKFLGRVNDRLKRLKYGNFGDYKYVGDEIFELRLHFGPGYRIYFNHEGNNIVILLCAGDKTSQKHDIKKAKKYLEDFRNA